MRVLDLFCGCGGLTLGFQKAGMEVVAGVDSWDPALDVYRRNFAHDACKLDLSDVDVCVERFAKLSVDMIAGGPPCQDFSSAGKRNEHLGRGDLTTDFASIVARLKPPWFLMENVPRIQKSEKLRIAKALFKAVGYGLTEVVLDASRCGVPQQRKRYFLVGRLGEADGFLAAKLEGGLSARPMTVSDFFGDALGVEYYYRHPRSYARRGIFSIHEPSPTVRGVNRPVPKGYRLHPNDPVNSLEGIRALTTKERSLIQTFPPEFEFLGTKTVMEQMIGNAVPVNLATYMGRAILHAAAREVEDVNAARSLRVGQYS